MADLWHTLQRQFGTRYHLIREISGAGMSRVFLAEEVALRRRVVIKILPPWSAATLTQRFRREVAVLARIQHPNVLPLLAAGELAGFAYLVTPYVDGGSLRDHMDARRIDPIAAIDVVSDVARALAYAAELGVVHRDIKPENVLISQGIGVLADFGIAQFTSEWASADCADWPRLTPAGIAIGSPPSVAPEQIVGDQVDGRADVYAVGVMLYELLTGRHPFAGKRGLEALLAAHLRDPVTPPSVHVPTLDPGLDEVVARCLAKAAADRYQHPRQLLEALVAIRRRSAGDRPAGLRDAWDEEAPDDASPPIVVRSFLSPEGDARLAGLAPELTRAVLHELERAHDLTVVRSTPSTPGAASPAPRPLQLIGRVWVEADKVHVVMTLTGDTAHRNTIRWQVHRPIGDASLVNAVAARCVEMLRRIFALGTSAPAAPARPARYPLNATPGRAARRVRS